MTIGHKQLGQIERYMQIITSTPQFNDSQMFWEFHVIGRKYDDYVKLRRESENNKGEPGLVMSAKNFKIYAKTWSELIGEFERRHEFLNELLQVERENLITPFSSPGDIITAQDSNSATSLPEYSPAMD